MEARVRHEGELACAADRAGRLCLGLDGRPAGPAVGDVMRGTLRALLLRHFLAVGGVVRWGAAVDAIEVEVIEAGGGARVAVRLRTAAGELLAGGRLLVVVGLYPIVALAQ